MKGRVQVKARAQSKARAFVALSGICAALGGCSVGPDYVAPLTPVPANFLVDAGGGPRSAPVADLDLRRWWRMLGDRELNSLVDRALLANLDLKIAVTRVQEARARLAGEGAYEFPAAGVSAGGGGGTGSDNTNGRVSPLLRAGENSKGLAKTVDAGGLVANWDIDLFGRVRREIEAETADAEALKNDRDWVYVVVAADVARAYLDMRAGERQLAVLRQNIEVGQRALALARSRLEGGLANELDVSLARRQLATLEAGRGPLTAQIETRRHAIAVLMGEFPETLAKELSRPGAMPSLPERIPVGVPVQLLRRRPDLAEIERRLAAANARIGVAVANLFPSVSLAGGLGRQQGPLATPTSIAVSTIWTLGPSISAPIFDFGALDAQIEVADLKTKELLIAYREAIIGAVRDVDDSVATYRAQKSRLADLDRALVAARDATRIATERYDRGLTDFLNVLDAERQQFDLEESQVAARQVEGEALVSLFKALGGGWPLNADIPPIRKPDPAAVAAVKYVTGTKP